MYRTLAVCVCALLVVAACKPVYDYHKTYITQLTNINFKDQVSKIRQNTNYVSIVHFYKYDGTPPLTQMASLLAESKSSISG